MDNLIGTRQAGKILGYVTAYMRELCSDKKIRKKLGARKIGRDWLFDKKTIEQLAEEKKKEKKKKL